MVQMLGSETITAKEYGQLLDVGFQEMRVGIIPPTADQVPVSYTHLDVYKRQVLNRGTILGLVPKTNLPNYAEYYEARHFTPADQDFHMVKIDGVEVPFGTKLLFSCPQMTGMKVAVEICEDLWVPNPPSVAHALAGANAVSYTHL